jgi:hypothetical protein
MRPLDHIFPLLDASGFRRRFHLGAAEQAYLKARGLDTVLEHARKFIAERLAQHRRSGTASKHPIGAIPYSWRSTRQRAAAVDAWRSGIVYRGGGR